MVGTASNSETVVSGSQNDKIPVIGQGMLLPFILVTTLFALWGFANDVTNPLVKVFKEVFVISNAQSSFVQVAFYFGYFTMALPAALFIQKYSYKMGILIGLALYAAGTFMTYPATATMDFWFFVLSLYILTFGLAFLETTANPYILSMGDPATATRRLNLAQAFNPIGSLTGMFIALNYVMSEVKILSLENSEAMKVSDPAAFEALQLADLAIVRGPYMAVGVVVTVMFLVFSITMLPNTKRTHTIDFKATVSRLFKKPDYVEGVIAQAFYVGAQIMCWTYIVHYGMEIIGLDGPTAQKYNIAAMVIFLISRFICTFLLGYIKPGKLLMILAVLGAVLTTGAIFLDGMMGLYSLVGISACMSLMFPTIYGIALNGLGEDARLGSAGLIMAIVGGALMPFLQGYLIDIGSFIPGTHAVQSSFVLPIVCFVVIAIYGYRAVKRMSA